MANRSSVCADILHFPLLLSPFYSDVPPDCSLSAEGPPRIECWQGALGEQQLPGWSEGGAGGKVCGGNRGGLEGQTPPAGSDEVREGQRAQHYAKGVHVLHACAPCTVALYRGAPQLPFHFSITAFLDPVWSWTYQPPLLLRLPLAGMWPHSLQLRLRECCNMRAMGRWSLRGRPGTTPLWT